MGKTNLLDTYIEAGWWATRSGRSELWSNVPSRGAYLGMRRIDEQSNCGLNWHPSLFQLQIARGYQLTVSHPPYS